MPRWRYRTDEAGGTPRRSRRRGSGLVPWRPGPSWTSTPTSPSPARAAAEGDQARADPVKLLWDFAGGKQSVKSGAARAATPRRASPCPASRRSASACGGRPRAAGAPEGPTGQRISQRASGSGVRAVSRSRARARPSSQGRVAPGARRRRGRALAAPRRGADAAGRALRLCHGRGRLTVVSGGRAQAGGPDAPRVPRAAQPVRQPHREPRSSCRRRCTRASGKSRSRGSAAPTSAEARTWTRTSSPTTSSGRTTTCSRANGSSRSRHGRLRQVSGRLSVPPRGGRVCGRRSSP